MICSPIIDHAWRVTGSVGEYTTPSLFFVAMINQPLLRLEGIEFSFERIKLLYHRCEHHLGLCLHQLGLASKWQLFFLTSGSFYTYEKEHSRRK